MGSQVGVQGNGALSEQVFVAGGSTVAGTQPAVGVPVLAPASVTSSGATTGGINRVGANALLLNIQCGAITGAGAFTAQVQHSNSDGVSDNYVNVPSTTQTSAGSSAATAAGGIGGTAANTDTQLFVDLRQLNAWVRVVLTNTAGTSAIIGITGVLAGFDVLPSSFEA